MKIYALVPEKFGLAMPIPGNQFMVRPGGIFLEKNGEDGLLIAQRFVLVCCVLKKILMV